MQKRSKNRRMSAQVIVVGGGMAGLCAALASARNGKETILVQDRPVLGGNASSEIRMHICGAGVDMAKPDMEETGILYELMLENKKYNDSYNYSIWSAVLWDEVRRQKHLQVFLNCVMHAVQMEKGAIQAIICYQSTTETEWTFSSGLFVDATGNGTLGFFAGAEYRIGSESEATYQEPHAPEKANNFRMGNTLLFKAVDTGHPVTFTAPPWAWHFSEEDLVYRNHASAMVTDEESQGVTLLDKGHNGNGRKYREAPCLDYGYWWIELTGKKRDIIDEYETIRDDLVSAVYGVWDHIKNGGEHGAANFELSWVGMLPGIRESRRLIGDYVLNENDVLGNRRFPDAVAYGGWPIDVHTPNGLLDKGKVPSFVYSFPGIYTIPYRCYYAKNIPNLFIAGRIISASKLAMASSRVMGTCAVGGQAVGTAAALCATYGCTPRRLGEEHMDELQQQLLRDDCYLPDVKNHDPQDLARTASISASSEIQPAANLINGVTRPENGVSNCWESAPLSEGPASVELTLAKRTTVREVRLTFVTDLSRPIKITMSSKRQKMQQIGVPVDLVRDFSVSLLEGGREVAKTVVEGNHQRLQVIRFPGVRCDGVRLVFTATNGSPSAKVFECRVYGRH